MASSATGKGGYLGDMTTRTASTAEISIDENSGIPIWLQLRNRLVFLIVSGEFKPHEKLPTVRELAVSLGVNYNTVSKVYQDIERDGYIVSKRGVGTHVADRSSYAKEGFEEGIGCLVDDFIRQCTESGVAKTEIVDLVRRRLDAGDAR